MGAGHVRCPAYAYFYTFLDFPGGACVTPSKRSLPPVERTQGTARMTTSKTHLKLRWFGAASATALTFAMAPAFAQTAAVADYRIEAQPLQKALVKFSEQSRKAVVAPTELLAGRKSSPVGGQYTAADALDALLAGSGLAAQVHENGAVTLVAARQTETLPGSGPLPSPQSAPEPEEPQTPAAAARATPEVVIVTGTRGEPRTVTDSPTPIDVFSSEDLEQGSQTGVFESMRYLVPSFNLPTRAGGGTATVIATGGLRGLNPDHTLVLVNGKRRHKTALINSVSALYNGAAGVDLNMIPASAIERIEVLRDGAAAQYGSDAIAGVINIILKEESEGGQLQVSAGENFDRSDGEYLTASANQGVALGEDGFATLSYSFMDRNASNRAVPVANSVRLYPLVGGQPDPREATIDRMVTQNYGGFPQTSHIFGANTGYELGNGVELYAFGTYGSRTSVLDWSYRAPNNAAAVPQIYPNGYRPRLTIYEDDYEVAAGVKADIAGWTVDVSSNYGADITDWENDNGLNTSLGVLSPTHFEVGRLISSEWSNSVDVTKPFDLASAGELQVSFGAQHRLEAFKVEQGDAASWAGVGAQATPGFRPDDETDISRNNYNAYGELGWTPSDQFFVGAALRYESFDDDAGDELIYKLTGRYDPFEWLGLRASFNTGFRAPTMAQIGYSSTTSQFRDIDGDGVTELVLLKNLPVNSAAAVALGSTPLVPETSENFSAGFVATPFSNFSLTVDAYQINVDDRIAVTTLFSPLDTRASAVPGRTIGQQIQAILVADGLSPEISGQYYTNAIDTETKGIDVVATYKLYTDYLGDFDFSLGYNKNETEIVGIIDNPPELDALGNIEIFDRGKQGALTVSIPDSKISTNVGWKFGDFGLDVRATRFGSYTSVNATNAASDYDVDPEWIADLEISYQLTDTFKLFAGANNIFNTYPMEVAPPGATTGSNQYNTLAPFGFTGGSWFVRGAYSW